MDEAGKGNETPPNNGEQPNEPDAAGTISITKDRGDLWRRALFMLLFGLLFTVARSVLGIVVVGQFLIVLFTGSANEQLLRLGSSLSIYAYQVLRFLTFSGDEHPFPMSDWPADEAADSPWLESHSVES